MWQCEGRGYPDVLLGDLTPTGQCCVRSRRAGDHHVRPHALDAHLETDQGDACHLAVGQDDVRQAAARGDHVRTHPLVGGGEAVAERLRVGLVLTAPTDDLHALGGIGRAGDVHREPEAVQQLGAEFALLGVHGPHEREARGSRVGDAVAFHGEAAGCRGIE